MAKIAICVPTHNRAKVVEDTLSKGIACYKKYGIDLYYYDSSEDDETKKIVERFINSGYSNINYIHVEKEIKKQAFFFSGEKREKKYDYIWPVKDRVWFEEPTIKKVCEAADEGYDGIFLGVLPCIAHPGISSKTYNAVEEFYLDWGYLVTSIDVSIYKQDTLLDGYTYDYLEKYDAFFTHFNVMFEKLAEGKKTVRTLVGNDIIAYNSNLITSGGKNNGFNIWVNSWIKANERLPEIYLKYRENVIKHAGVLPWIFGTVDSIIDYKNNGAFETWDMEYVLDNWERVSDIPKEKLIQIARGTYDKRHDIDLVSKHRDEFLDLLVQMTKFVVDGKMPKRQIPYDDVFQGVMNKIVKKYQNDMNMVNVVAGSVEDTLLFIRDKAKTNDEIERGFQMLISITIAAM